MRILIVEEAGVSAFRGLLNQWGYEIGIVANRSDVLQALELERADVVLDDTADSFASGIQLALLVADYQPNCHVVLLSGSYDASFYARLGFDWAPYRVLRKPVDPRDLHCVLQSFEKHAA